MNLLTEYDACWLEEIEYYVLGFTHKTSKEMLAQLLAQCTELTNREKRAKLKETEFPWLAEEDVSIYFSKLDKKQERLKKMSIKWDNTPKLTKAVDKMYNSNLFKEKQRMEWEDKDDVNKKWGVGSML